jgi:outer membrane receptor protein involved in Fe transport
LFAFEGGFNLYSVFGTQDETVVKAYPKLLFSFHTATKNFTVYAGLNGYLENNNYSKIAAENRWINPTLIALPTSHLSTISAGISGKITTPLTFNIGIKYGKTEDQYFYVTRVINKSGIPGPALKDLTYNNAFEVVYDDLSTLDFSGDLSYTTSSVFLLLSGHYYSNQLKTLEKAPYMPDFTLNASSEFKIIDHFSALAEMYLTGPRNIMLKYYMSPISSAIPPPPIYLKADPVIDVNIGAKYMFTNKFELFGKVENLLNRKDEIWYGYTVQGIRFKLGASFFF